MKLAVLCTHAVFIGTCVSQLLGVDLSTRADTALTMLKAVHADIQVDIAAINANLSKMSHESTKAQNATAIAGIHESLTNLNSAIVQKTTALMTVSKLEGTSGASTESLSETNALLQDITTELVNTITDVLGIINQSTLIQDIASIVVISILDLLKVVGTLVRDIPALQNLFDVVVKLLETVLQF